MVETDVFVTGMGWSTALGSDLHGVWQSLQAGRTGFQAMPHPRPLRNALAAPVPGLPLPPGLRLRTLATRTIDQAIHDAGASLDDPGIQLILGTSLGAWLDDPAETSAGLDAWAREVAVASGITLPAVALSTACSSGSDAIAYGAGLIRSGLAHTCVCGGADVLTPAKRLAHSTLGTLSMTHLRAFDRRHDGTLLGEGAAFMVLQHRPGTRPYARLVGMGAGNDATGFTSPDGDARGALFALRRSLAHAGLEPGAIGLINAHGSGTPMNDAAEAIAFRTLFQGLGKPIAFATKGNFGHTLGATGAMEAIVTVLALAAGQVPPVAGLEQPDPAFPLTLPMAHPLPCAARFGVSLTLGFGGFNTSLIFERYP